MMNISDLIEEVENPPNIDQEPIVLKPDPVNQEPKFINPGV